MRTCVAIVAILAVGGAWGARWDASTAAEFARGELEGTEIDEHGAVVLASARETLWGPEQGIVWDVAVAPDGSIFAALSSPGRVLRVRPDGEVESWYRGDEDTLITAVAASAEGGVYFGLAPDGSVIDLEAPERIRREYATDARFIWDIAAGADGSLWAATGLPGSLVVSRDGEPFATVHETGDDPVRSLVVGEEQTLFGTGGNGRVYRWRDERAFVIFDADAPEIVALALDEEGVAYALAARDAKQVARGPQPPAERTESNFVQVTARAPEGGAEEKPAKEQERKPTARLSGGGGGVLYRIEPVGAVRALWQTSAELPFAMVGPIDGRLVVATGDGGVLHRVDSDGRSTRLSRIGSSQASALALAADGAIVVGGTSDARLERLSAEVVASGYYLSEAIDAGAPTRWGRVRSEGAGARPIEIRVGNTEEADESWSRWRRLEDGVAPAGLPLTRFAQLRVELRGRGTPGRLSRLALHYRTANRAPTVAKLSVEPPGVVWVRSAPQPSATGAPFVADDPVTRETAAALRRNGNGQLRRFFEPGVRTISWNAEDPDEDRLRARLELRREGEAGWFELAGPIEDAFYAWDARGVPDGTYRVRLTVEDAPDRAPDELLSDSEISDAFEVDHTRPTISNLSLTEGPHGWTLEFNAEDRGGWLRSAELSVDGEPWRPVRASDGVVDSSVERFEVVLPPGARPGVRVRVTDHAGNVAGTYDER